MTSTAGCSCSALGTVNNTSFHLAEYRAPGGRRIAQGVPILNAVGQRVWVRFDELELDESPFPELGAAFERDTGQVRVGAVGSAEVAPVPAAPSGRFCGAMVGGAAH